jgi:DNA-binding FrmR family transcriptional regulator
VPEKFQGDVRAMRVMIETRKDCYSGRIHDVIEQAEASAAKLRLMAEGNSLHPGGLPGL